MDADLQKRLEYLEQRLNLLQASVDTLAVMLAGIQIKLPKSHFTEKQLGPLLKTEIDGYSVMRDQRSSKLSEFPFVPPEEEAP